MPTNLVVVTVRDPDAVQGLWCRSPGKRVACWGKLKKLAGADNVAFTPEIDAETDAADRQTLAIARVPPPHAFFVLLFSGSLPAEFGATAAARLTSRR